MLRYVVLCFVGCRAYIQQLHPAKSQIGCMRIQVPNVLPKQFADRNGLTPLSVSACLSIGATPSTRQALAVHMGGVTGPWVGALQAVGGAGLYTGSGGAQPPPPPPPPTPTATLRPVSAVQVCKSEHPGYHSVHNDNHTPWLSFCIQSFLWHKEGTCLISCMCMPQSLYIRLGNLCCLWRGALSLQQRM